MRTNKRKGFQKLTVKSKRCKTPRFYFISIRSPSDAFNRIFVSGPNLGRESSEVAWEIGKRRYPDWIAHQNRSICLAWLGPRGLDWLGPK